MKRKSNEELVEQGKKVQKVGAGIFLVGCLAIILVPIVAFIIIALL